MKTLTIDLENCYGIKKLNHPFDFSRSSTYAIYAPNGVMKTSFAKTFRDLSKGEETMDLMFPDRETKRAIQMDGIEMSKDEVFVIEAYNEGFRSDKVSNLIANKELKEKYEKIHIKIDESKGELLKKLQQSSDLKAGIEEEISKIFGKENLFEVMLELEPRVLKQEDAFFNGIIYALIFNDKALSFLKENKSEIGNYIEKYDELLGKSKYLKRGFNHYKASEVQKSLRTNGFFNAQHSLRLFNEETKGREEVESEEAFSNLMQEEKSIILNDPELVKKWQKIADKLAKNTELRALEDHLLDHKDIILPELRDVDHFAKEIWISYFVEQKDLFRNFLAEYKKGEAEIKKIIDEAQQEQELWKEVIEEFNARFSVPFKISVGNQEDVICKSSEPVFEYIFTENGETSPKKEKTDILKALSQGEKRAMYLLNIIFEVKAREKAEQKTLFVVDDIADSFDYKNKYAIIQYLQDISTNSGFYQIILTHNFDFFRTIESRKLTSYDKCLFAQKGNNKVILLPAKGIKNPFITDWKQNLSDPKKLISSIPFVRNIIEYTSGTGNCDYLKCTSLLHWKKNDTENIEMAELKSVFENTFGTTINFPEDNLHNKVVDFIFQEAQNCLSANEGINLENKIVLSIAIRLKAEHFIWSKVSDQNAITGYQEKVLLKRFKDEFERNPNEKENLKILEEVNLMTPENIHLNSFMYEPILDMGDDHLKSLYKKSLSLK